MGLLQLPGDKVASRSLTGVLYVCMEQVALQQPMPLSLVVPKQAGCCHLLMLTYIGQQAPEFGTGLIHRSNL